MSDDEQYREEEEASEEEEEEKPKPKTHAAEDEGPSEAALAMQRRKEKKNEEGDDFIKELREQREIEKAKELEEINALKEKQARRKREREEEEKRLAELRVQEEARRRAEEEERKKKKEEEERKKRAKRDQARVDRERMMAAIGKPNFVITKRSETSDEGEVTDLEAPKEPVAKSREQLEEEKRAILKQRIQPLNTSGFDLDKLCEKARELHNLLLRLESEKYDLEERFKSQQYDMMELAERARQMSKGGKAKPGSGAARAQQQDEGFDALADRFTSAPPKIEMFSKYERQKDKRTYSDKKTIFLGPNWAEEVQKVTPTKKVQFFSDQGPVVEDLEGVEQPAPVEEDEE